MKHAWILSLVLSGLISLPASAENDVVFDNDAGGAGFGSTQARTYLAGPLGPVGTQPNPEVAVVGREGAWVADYNNDGFVDFIYDDIAGSGINYWARTYVPAAPQPGPAGSQLSAEKQAQLSVPIVAIGDYDNDGIVEVLFDLSGGVGAYGNIIAREYTYATVGSPEPVFVSDTPIVGRRGILLGDYDNDGLIDLFYNDSTTADNYYVRTYTDATTFIEVQVGVSSSREIIAIGDYNNDGKNDLVYDDIIGAGISLWAATHSPGPAGPAAVVDNQVSLGIGRDGVQIADYDNDGQYDFIYDDNLSAPFKFYARTYAPAAPAPAGGSLVAGETNFLSNGPFVVGDYNNSCCSICDDVQAAATGVVCAGGLPRSYQELAAAIEAAYTTALGGKPLCGQDTAASCLADLLAAAGL